MVLLATSYRLMLLYTSAIWLVLVHCRRPRPEILANTLNYPTLVLNIVEFGQF